MLCPQRKELPCRKNAHLLVSCLLALAGQRGENILVLKCHTTDLNSLIPAVSLILDIFIFFREIIFEVVPLLSNNMVSRTDMGDAKRMLRTTRKALLLSSQNSFRDLCGTGGVQLGNTKVFFRQVSIPLTLSLSVGLFVFGCVWVCLCKTYVPFLFVCED